jgi:hypothetical protein
MLLASVRAARAALMLCGLLLAACDAVEDVAQRATVPEPPPTDVIRGTIVGLGARRPLVLQNNDDVAGARSFLNTFGQQTSVFSFDPLPTGTPYHIKVKSQPFAKVCTVQNGRGRVGDPDAAPITVTCVNDPAVPRYCVGGTLTQAVRDTPGARIVLTTEEGTRERPVTDLPVGGPPTCWFDDALFNSATSIPVFTWSVTAVFTDPSGKVNNCAVANGGNPLAGTAPDLLPAPPTANVLDVQVTACSFTVTAAVALQPGSLPQPLGAGLVLALREPRTGVHVRSASVASFGSVPFNDVPSNADAQYELVVVHQPQGQACIVGGIGQLQWAGAVLLLNPADTAHGWIIARNVRCIPVPPPANRLGGTYQLAVETTPGGTSRTRNFLTFFDDGTFLYGVHAFGVTSGPTGGPASAASGVEHGFYNYDPVAATLTLVPLTDTITGSNPARLSTGGAARTLTGVTRSAGAPARITATFNATTTWVLTEPRSIEGQMTGSWATPDHRRVWIYDGSNYAGFHAGVNGLGNAQDACFPIDPPGAQSGYYTRRGNSTTCQLLDGTPSSTQMYTLEVPGITTTPRAPEGFIGKWPQSGSNADGRPSSPVYFTITPGSPDVLTVQDSATDGTPRYPPVVLTRMHAE